MHPHVMQDSRKAQGPRLSCHNPVNGLSRQPLRAQLNLTNDHKKKEKPHLKNEPAWTEKVRPVTAASCFNTFDDRLVKH